jgi:serine protease
MSLGGPLWNPFEFRVFGRLLEEEGIISFAAAGNSAGTWLVYPASYNGVRSVAAVDKDMNHAKFSQSNHRVDLAAPGVDVLSLLPKGDCTICEATGATNGYGITSGSSMATPHAAGVAALLWSFKPEATAEEILTAMELSATDLGSPGHDTKYGHGLVNAIEALKILNGGPLSEGPSVSMEISEELANPILAVEEDEDEELEPISESSSPPTPIFTPSTLEQTNATSIAMAASQTEFDEEKSSNACSTGHVSFDLTLQTDAYGSEVSWELFNGRDGRKVLSVDTDTLRDNRLYQKQICVPDDCYVFSIYDSQNDG